VYSDTSSGYSEPSGLVQDYSYDMVVTATACGVVWSLPASVDTACDGEATTFGCQVTLLSDGTYYVMASGGCDGDNFQTTVEEERGRRKGQRFVGPRKPRHDTGQRPGPARRRR
jgi:hypothetical protein